MTITSLSHDSIQIFRQRRTERLLGLIRLADADIYDTLVGNKLPPTFVEAVAHQLVYSVNGRSPSDIASIVAQRWPRFHSLLESVDDGIAVTYSPLDRMNRIPSVFDDEVGRDTTPEIAAGIAAARRSLNASQYGSIFSASVGIVVALRPISLTDTATSFTNPSVSGSVYCNILHEIPALIARDLLHEATHCWFNNYLAATGVALERSVPKFHSPWKQAARPAFGFAHSVISFSIVCLYLAGEVNMCKESDDYTARVLKVLLDRERERLASVCDDIDILAAEYPALEFLPRLTHEATSKQTI